MYNKWKRAVEKSNIRNNMRMEWTNYYKKRIKKYGECAEEAEEYPECE